MQIKDHQSSSDSELIPGVVSTTPLIDTKPTANGSEGIKADLSASTLNQRELDVMLKFGEETHQYVRDYIRQADQKAAFFFAGLTALLTYLNSLGFTNKWFINPSSWTLIHILSFIATMCLIIGSMCCILTVMPRLGGTKRGVIFFQGICEYEGPFVYSEDILNHTPRQLCNEKYKHTYELSCVCRDKYSSLIWGFRFGITGVVVFFILLAMK